MKVYGGYKKAKFYFNQFWAYENPAILANDKLRPVLYKIWLEVWRKFDVWYEDRLFDICKFYKKRILKGKSIYEGTGK